MKKKIPFFIGIFWTIAIAVLACVNSLSWNDERKVSVCKDGYSAGNTCYLLEELEKDSVLYVTDKRGRVKELMLSSSLWPESVFEKLDYGDTLYAVLKGRIQGKNETEVGYKIVRFDGEGKPDGASAAFYVGKDGILTGFQADEEGFYLTFIMDSGETAGMCFVEGREMKELSGLKQKKEGEGQEPQKVKLSQLVSCEPGRLFVEAAFEENQFILRRDDGSNAEAFAISEDARTAFQERSLSAFQFLKLRRETLMLYIQLLLVGYVLLFLLFAVFRNRNHIVYTIVAVEMILFVVSAAGAFQIRNIGRQAREEEAERFGFYYIESLADEIGDPRELPLEEDFYTREEYYALRNRMAGFVSQDGISEVFTDICLVESESHRIVASASGYNGRPFEEVYGSGSLPMFTKLARGDGKAGANIRIGGRDCELLGVGTSDRPGSDYLLAGVTGSEYMAGASGVEGWPYLVYAELFFLLGSVVCIGLLMIQGRDLRQLASGMRKVAQGQAEVQKGTAYGRDVDMMWNSLMEIQRTISRINYTKYRIFESCYRFAPKNVEKILGKDSITEVKGGDMILLNGTVAFTSSTEPEDNGQSVAEMMNRFITLIEEHQEESQGFFVSGQSSLTRMKILFLEEYRETVAFGASAMRHIYEERSLEDLRTGMLLHYCQCAYGVAGTERQSFPFLLSKELEEIEKYAGWFQRMHLRLVITESVKNREALEGAVRYIGYILITATGRRMKLYEVLDAESQHMRRLKTETDEKFQGALSLFYRYDFYLARNSFSDVLKENPADDMAKWYLFTCEKYLNETHFQGDICRLDCEEQFREQI